MANDNTLLLRQGSVDRLRARLSGLAALGRSRRELSFAEDGMVGMARTYGINGLNELTNIVQQSIIIDAQSFVDQLAFLVARDIIAPQARQSLTPVVAITGNSYVPPLREVTHCEDIWQMQDDAAGLGFFDLWERLADKLDSNLTEQDIYMSCFEGDNSLFAVDLRRWKNCDEGDEDQDSGWEIINA